jgi:hypothetical protein
MVMAARHYFPCFSSSHRRLPTTRVGAGLAGLPFCATRHSCDRNDACPAPDRSTTDCDEASECLAFAARGRSNAKIFAVGARPAREWENLRRCHSRPGAAPTPKSSLLERVPRANGKTFGVAIRGQGPLQRQNLRCWSASRARMGKPSALPFAARSRSNAKVIAVGARPAREWKSVRRFRIRGPRPLQRQTHDPRLEYASADNPYLFMRS